MLFEGIRPTILPLNRQPDAASRLRAGQTLQTRVEGSPGKLFVQVAGARVPLGREAALQPGQLVRLAVRQGAQGLELQLTPATASAQQAPQSDAALRELLALVLGRLPNAPGAETARPLVPAHLPRTAEALQQLLSLFAARGELGQNVADLQALLNQAAAAGAFPQHEAEAFAALVASFAARDTEAWKSLLQRLGKGNLEGRLATALARGAVEEVLDELAASLRAQVARLRGNTALLAWLRGQQQLEQFESLADRVLERLSAGQLQNLRALEQPYLFVEIPTPEQSGFEQVHVHFFDDGRKEKAAFDKDNATIVLDVTTHHLGALWVMLRIARGYCQCTFRATSGTTREAIEKHAPQLAEALEKTGYRQARIDTVPWDGDRLRAAADLMQRFGGLNINV